MPQLFTKPLIIFALMFVFSNSAWSQKLLTPSRQSSYYTYIYKLSDADVLAFYKSPAKPFDDRALHNPVDSFRTDETWHNTLPPGNYLKVYAEINNLKYALLENHSVFLKLFVNQHEHRFALTDKHGQFINQAVVMLNGKTVPFDEKSGTWYFANGNKSNTIKVEYKGISNFFSIAEQKNYYHHQKYLLQKLWQSIKNIFKKNNNDYQPNKYTGFMIFNKPVYKPHDTVKFKAFILNQHTKRPVTSQQLLVKVGDRNEMKTMGTVTSYRKGGFEYSFVLSDSLDFSLDDNYNVELSEIPAKNKPKIDSDDEDEQERNKRTLISGSFKYEEYELKSIKFAIRADKKEHWPGNPLAIYLKATDENDLPVPDGRISLKLITRQVSGYKLNHAYVPDTLWLHNQPLDPVGETKVLIPDSIFPKADVDYNIEAQFLNSNNEQQNEDVWAKFIYRRFNIITDLSNDTLKATYQELGKPASAPAVVSALNANGDTISKTKITLPGYLLINPNAATYNIATDSTDTDLELKDFESNISLSGERTADSVFINVSNPRKLPLFFSVFKGGERIDGGKGVKVAYKVGYSGNKPVTYSVNYIWAGEVKKEEASVVFRKDLLNIDVKQPVSVYPGQRVKTEIVVTDAAGKPVANADLTAWALTKKFQYSMPYAPYLGKGYKRAKLKNVFKITDLENSRSLKLNWAHWSREMGLDSITYFQFTHPKSTYRIEEPGIDTVTQIAPFIVKDGNVLPVHILYIDERPVYFSQAQQLNPYSFKVRPGLHSLRFRLDTMLVKLDTVRVTQGKKLIISFNADGLAVTKIKDSLSIYEADLINKYMVTIVNNFDQKKSLILQDDHTFFLNSFGNAGNTILTGPLTNSYTIFDHQGSSQQFFTAEPGYSYWFETGLIRQKSIPTAFPFKLDLSKVKGADDYRQYVLTNHAADSIWQNYLDTRSYSQPLFNNPTIYDRQTGRLVIARDMVKNEKYILIKNVILYRYDDPDYIRIYPGNTTDFGGLTAGKYRLFFLLKGDAYDIKESIEVKLNGINYYETTVRPVHAKDAISTAINGVIDNRNSNTYNNYDYQIENDALKLKEAFNDQYLDLSGFDQLITGRVMDKYDKEPLVGVSIRVKGTSIGTQTDVNGNFKLKAPSNGKLVITYIGYITKEVNAKIGQPLKINLFASYKSLNEVVVVGYGSVSRKERLLRRYKHYYRQ